MELLDRIKQDLKAAMKARDRDRVDGLRMLVNALDGAAKDKGRDLDESEAIEILAGEAKRRRESVEAYEQGGRDELAARERTQLELIEGYLPEPLSADDVRAMAREVADEVGARSKSDLGRVMRELMPRVKGRFPGKEVKPLVEEILAG